MLTSRPSSHSPGLESPTHPHPVVLTSILHHAGQTRTDSQSHGDRLAIIRCLSVAFSPGLLTIFICIVVLLGSSVAVLLVIVVIVKTQLRMQAAVSLIFTAAGVDIVFVGRGLSRGRHIQLVVAAGFLALTSP